jgi:very-short-patch-repair endonuclease
MATEARMVVRWWTVPPIGQVSYLAGAGPELLRIALDPLPETAPAVVQFCPSTVGPLGDQVMVLLQELDQAAIELFPRWLPGAERLDGSLGVGVPAVRELAARLAARSQNFGPFLADLAERALCGRAQQSRFPSEVRARGLARVIAEAFERESVALLIEVPDVLVPDGERALVAAAEWLAHYGHLSVWLAGAPLRVVDRVPAVTITLPAYLTQLIGEVGEIVDEADVGPRAVGGWPIDRRSDVAAGAAFWYPPLLGLPSPNSPAEQRLEKALALHEWARGRCWNYRYEWHLLARPYRLDIFWPAEGLAVEVDGDDHRERLKFADDRRRDAQLHQLGHLVVRFTNEDVLGDVQAVVRTIEQLLNRRRKANTHSMELRKHVEH